MKRSAKKMKPAMKLDAVTLAVMNNRLAAIAEEMGVVLGQTGFSPNIKERRDFSCALFDGARRTGRAGRAYPRSSRLDAALGARRDRAARARSRRRRGGQRSVRRRHSSAGRHAGRADFSWQRAPRPFAFVANRAHHADIGGMAPGSMALATEIYQEGFRLPPVKLMVERQAGARRLRAVLRQHTSARGTRGRPARADCGARTSARSAYAG